MKRLLLAVSFLLTYLLSDAQLLSYTCPRDTVLGCSAPCFSIKGRFPDLRSNSGEYSIMNISNIAGCRPYVGPGDVGPSTSLVIDDRYSAVINLPFNFPFYGASYPSLVASTNGYLSFDVSLTGGFADWSLASGNVPNTNYDGALVMGPWHDLDPSVTTSPNQKIKYNVIGSAPNRKWVLSFYKVPLFSAACNNLIENTHQIILHESSGVIEVFVFDKQQCPGWNTGRAMIGLQDITKTKAIMAPGRTATDAPWGTVGMNESWRFIPKNGTTLYQSVELLDASGTSIATGDTTRIDSVTFETTFPNVCPPSGNSLYVIKTTYKKIDDPTQTFYSLDTINVNRLSGLPFTWTTTQSTCGQNTGTITVTPQGGTAPYQYGLNGGPLQSSNVFTGLAAGTYSVYVVDSQGCDSTNTTITITNTGTLPSTVTSVNASCASVNNGSITVTPTLGTAPFTYSINSGPAQASNTFNGLAPGSYTITFTDANLCTGTASATITAGAALTFTTTSTSVTCPGANNGTITVTGVTSTNGTAPYTYNIDGGTYSSNTVFSGLTGGSHTIGIMDANGCTGTRTIFISTGASISSTVTTTSVTCATATNGTATVTPTNGTAPYTYQIDGGAFGPSNTFNNLSAGNHTVNISDANGCTGTRTVFISTGSGISGSSTFTATSCPGVNNGTITLTPSNGTAPYTYSLDGGASQASNTFTNVSAGSHTVTFTDASGCAGSSTLTVTAGPGISANASLTATSCPSVSNGTITITPTTGTAPYTYSIDSGPYQASNVLTGVAAGPHAVNFMDANGCIGTVNINMTSGPSITGTFSTTATSCPTVSDGTVTVTPTSGTAPYNYSLDGGATQASATFTGLTTGAHSVVFTDASGCQGTVNFTINAGPSLTGSAVGTATSCPTVNDGTITVTPTSGTAPYQYSLNAGPSQASNIFTNLAPGTYNLGFTDAIGCTGTTTATVTQGASLGSNIVTTNPPCANINDGVITVNPTSGQAPYSYSLNGGTAQSSNTFTGLAPGSYTINFTDALGCTGSGTATLTTNSPLALTVSLTMPLCFHDNNGVITIGASGGVPAYEYSMDAGVTYQASGTFAGLTANTYTFRVRDNVGCIKDSIVTLSEPTLLTASAVSLPGTCNGNDGTITVTAGGGTPAYQYSIDNGTTYQPGTSFTVSGGSYPNIKVKDANNCEANTNVTVVLIDNMFLTLGTDSTICVESTVRLEPQTNPEVSIFQWTSPDALISTLDYDTVKNPIATPTDTATYILHATWGVCSRIDTIIINVKHKPIPQAGPDKYVCFDNPVTFLQASALDTSGPVIYSWAPAATLDTPDSSYTVAHPDSTQLYVLTVLDDYGCNFDVKDSMFVYVQPPVPAFAGNDTIAVSGQPHQMMASGGAQYEWTPAGPLNLSTIANPLATLLNDQQFVVKVTDVGGCIGYDTVFVQVYNGPTYYVPNSFTPNNDGLNDYFRAVPVGISYTEWFRVFNRFGELVFSTNQWLKGWDGNFLGKPVQSGTYVWMIKGMDKNGKVVEKRGTVILIR